MTLKLSMSREEIVTALLGEPLVTFDCGSWANSTTDRYGYDSSRFPGGVCKACAVGVIVRRLLSCRDSASDVRRICWSLVEGRGSYTYASQQREEDMLSDAEDLVSVGYYFNAISLLFEGLFLKYDVIDEHGCSIVISKICNFVEQKFPEQICIDVDDDMADLVLSKRIEVLS